jgi:hypothetical protein
VNPNKAQRLLAAAFLNFVIEQRTLLNRVSFGKERSEDSCDQGPNKHESCIMREATQDVSDIVNLEADNEMEDAETLYYNVLAQALALPPEGRRRLVEDLQSSLEVRER